MQKAKRHAKILELIREREVETQEELCALLQESGYPVTQATVSRDIRELKLTKISVSRGRRKYASLAEGTNELEGRYIRVFTEGAVSMDMAQNILVIKTVSGMAMAVAAALDAMQFPEVLGCIAGDDTIMAAVRTTEDTTALMSKLHEMLGK